MRTTIYALLGLILLVFTAPIPAQEEVQKSGVQKLMDDKLRYAKMLLEAVATGNFNKVNESCEKLIQISKTAEWLVHKTPRYELHSNEFRRAAENLIQKAKAKNQDGIALGYVELSMTCFRCHQYVRELRDVNIPNQPLHPFALQSNESKNH